MAIALILAGDGSVPLTSVIDVPVSVDLYSRLVPKYSEAGLPGPPTIGA
jgi:hypothetical protein